jgi:hypothetical protein
MIGPFSDDERLKVEFEILTVVITKSTLFREANWGSTVSIATAYGMDDGGVGV